MSKQILREPKSIFFQRIEEKLSEHEIAQVLNGTINLGLNSDFELIGEESIFTNNPNNEFTFVADSLNVDVICIKQSLIRSFPESILEHIQKFFDLKINHRIFLFEHNVKILLKSKKTFSGSHTMAIQPELVANGQAIAITQNRISAYLAKFNNSISEIEMIKKKKLQTKDSKKRILLFDSEKLKNLKPTFALQRIEGYRKTSKLLADFGNRQEEIKLFQRAKSQNTFLVMSSVRLR